MADYKKTVKSEASEIFQEVHPGFLDDDGEFGGKSDSPNFVQWLDRTKELEQRVEKAVSAWGTKEFLWVKSGTRNPSPAGGDPRSAAFGSYYSDLLHELKRLGKKK